MYNSSLISIWNTKKSKDSYVRPHRHNYYELVYYRSGMGTTCIDGREYAYQGSAFVIIPPGIEHDETHSSTSDIYCAGFLCDCSLPLVFCKDNEYKILNLAKAMLEESKNQRFGYKDVIKSKLTELCIEILRTEKHSGTANKSFEYVINYLSENYHEKIELKKLAEQLNLSYDYFQHKFKAITGFSPQQFLIEKRLEIAKNMLSSGDFNCTEIAYRCGFSNSAQFSMLFKKKFGMSPLEFKKEC